MAMEFAAAVIAQGHADATLRAEYRDHLQRAIAGAKRAIAPARR